MSTSRRCCRPGCGKPAVATLTYSQSKFRATLRELAPENNPHAWDLCVDHASRIGAPVGWTLIDPCGFSRKTRRRNVESLTALAEAVREKGRLTTGLVAEPPAPAGPVPPPAGPGGTHPSQMRRRPGRRRHLHLVADTGADPER